MAEPQGLLLDWGGVMTTSLYGSFASFCETEGIDPTVMGKVFRKDQAARELLFDFECGRIGELTFEPGLAKALGVANHDGLVRRLFGGMKLEHSMIEAVKRIRGAGIRTGLLSNSWGESTYPRELLPKLFDVTVISGEEGVRKPEAEIYEIARSRIELPFEQLVFVDDLPFNLDPARELGMTAVHHTGPSETIGRLEKIFQQTLAAFGGRERSENP